MRLNFPPIAVSAAAIFLFRKRFSNVLIPQSGHVYDTSISASSSLLSFLHSLPFLVANFFFYSSFPLSLQSYLFVVRFIFSRFSSPFSFNSLTLSSYICCMVTTPFSTSNPGTTPFPFFFFLQFSSSTIHT